jgi:hypothetical protein
MHESFDLTALLASDDLGPELLGEAAIAVHAAVRRKDHAAVRALGEQLDHHGGFELMQEVHRRLTGRMAGSARLVEMLWTGIGFWRG